MRARWVALTLCSLMLVACGARLTEQQRLAGIGAGPGGAAPTSTGGPVVNPTTGETVGPGATVGPTTGTTTGPTTGPTSGPGATCATNGESTDTGVTGSEITIAVASDVTGVQPGLFKSTWEATEAAARYINSLGGVCGRQLKVLKIDTKTDDTGNRAAVLQACDKAFALVGSTSALDGGGARAVDECKIPDITAVTTNMPRVRAEYTYPAYPNRADYILPAGGHIQDIKPGVIKNAAMLYLNATVARSNALGRVDAYEKAKGFDFIYTQAVQLVEANYSSYVVAMKNHDPPIKYVSMVGDYQSIARLLKAMRQQNWYPEVLDFDSVVYSPGFHTNAEGAGEGLHFFINTAMLEEASGNPEMQNYQTYLQQSAPGATPDYFGIYAWSATRMFGELATAVGPDLTREKLMTKLRALHSWDGFGIHAPHDIGRKIASGCFLYGIVRGTTFVREYPKSGFACNEGKVIPV